MECFECDGVYEKVVIVYEKVQLDISQETL
jgi:hypothetical protein